MTVCTWWLEALLQRLLRPFLAAGSQAKVVAWGLVWCGHGTCCCFLQAAGLAAIASKAVSIEALGAVLLPYCCRARRKFQRGLKRKPMTLIKKLRKAKKECEEGEKPNTVRTHLRNMTIVPEMIGSIVGVYNGKTFNQVSLLAAVLWGTGPGALAECHSLRTENQECSVLVQQSGSDA